MPLTFTKQTKLAHENDRIIIRLPDGLHEKLGTVARESHRTMTAVAVTLIEAGLAKYTPGLNRKELSNALTRDAIVSLNEIIERATSARSALSAKQLTD